MAVHFQWGRGRSLAWVTRLAEAKPVAGPKIAVSDSCSGTLLATATTDASGRAMIGDVLPEPSSHGDCRYGQSPLMVSARTGDDRSFTLTTWSRGITPGDFSLPSGGDAERAAYNFEGDAMGAGVSGVVGAAPVWRAVMLHLHRDMPGGPLGQRGEARTVRFDPAIEPLRREWFIPGTALDTVRVAATTTARPRIVAPADGTVVALDPDISRDRQRIAVVVAGGGQVAIDGRPLRAPFLWSPGPRHHRITLTDGGRRVDATRLTVR